MDFDEALELVMLLLQMVMGEFGETILSEMHYVVGAIPTISALLHARPDPRVLSTGFLGAVMLMVRDLLPLRAELAREVVSLSFCPSLQLPVHLDSQNRQLTPFMSFGYSAFLLPSHCPSSHQLREILLDFSLWSRAPFEVQQQLVHLLYGIDAEFLGLLSRSCGVQRLLDVTQIAYCRVASDCHQTRPGSPRRGGGGSCPCRQACTPNVSCEN